MVGKGAPVEERSFAETLSDAARYVTSSEEEDGEEENVYGPRAPVPGPSIPRELVSRAAIEQSVKMKQVRPSAYGDWGRHFNYMTVDQLWNSSLFTSQTCNQANHCLFHC